MKGNKKLYEVYVSDRDQNNRIIARRKRGITSDRDAKELEFTYKRELRDIAEQKPSLKWGKWHDEFIKRVRLNSKASTVALYDGYLKKWIPTEWIEKSMEQISAQDVYNLLQKSSDKLGTISQKNILKMLRRVFQAAMDEGLITKNPTRGIVIKTSVKIQKVLTAREADILLQLASSTNHRFYYVWAFALMTGMRSGEMYALEWTDINLDAGIISVSKQWTNKDGFHDLKTNDWRVVPISANLKGLLGELRSKNEPHKFVLPRLQEWTHGDQAKVLREFCLASGITSVKFHDLRATFITNMLAQGVPLVKCMAIVGHKKMETTDIYLRLAGVDIKGATEALGYSAPKEGDQNNLITVNFGNR
jgi:integrase